MGGFFWLFVSILSSGEIKCKHFSVMCAIMLQTLQLGVADWLTMGH